MIDVDPPTRTPEGQPNRCPICGKLVVIEPSHPPGDAPCPHCGCLFWFAANVAEGVFGFHSLSFSGTSIGTKEQAISGILDRLVESKALDKDHRQGVLAAILKREQLGSTGIGRGVAIPHAKYPGVRSVLGAIATFPEGVQFDSVDGDPVTLVCLLVSPADRPGDHLRALEMIARRLREER